MRAVIVALLAIPLAGCFQSSTVIHVKADGSGTIEQRTLLTETAMDQLRTLAILGGGNPDAADPTSEAQAKAVPHSFWKALASVVLRFKNCLSTVCWACVWRCSE